MTGDGLDVREPAVHIWLLQYGPCWCRSIPSDTSSFDYVRLRKTVADLGTLEANLLIVTDRVIDGSGKAFRQVYEEVPEPKLVISAGTCPFAHRFWDGLPNGWSPVEEVLPIDIHVDGCINGEPEALLAAVLAYVLASEGLERKEGDGGQQGSRQLEKASTDA